MVGDVRVKKWIGGIMLWRDGVGKGGDGEGGGGIEGSSGGKGEIQHADQLLSC